jgi:hypothetical protein
VSPEQQSQRAPVSQQARGTSAPPDSASNARSHGWLRAKLPFFRAMLWVLNYALCVVFFFSLILLGGFRLQVKILGGCLVACIVLLVATYLPRWRN